MTVLKTSPFAAEINKDSKIAPKSYHDFYPALVGLLLGLLQTGLFFQLTFTLSSTFGTFLLVTLCWLVGSAVGVLYLNRMTTRTQVFLGVALLAYAACGGLLALFPFGTALWPLYAGLILITGFYPGVFFARMEQHFPARILFARENNGFILGLVLGTILFMLAGRIILWVLPLTVAMIVIWLDRGGQPKNV
ncbi:MAG: hypothetical protein ABI690_11105 [Chloroflexota bacterium]